MHFKTLKVFLAVFIFMTSLSTSAFANPAAMVVRNNSKELTYEIQLKIGEQSYMADIEPGARKELGDIITDRAYDEIPDYLSMTIRTFYHDVTYKHSRLWIEKNTFIALSDPRHADFKAIRIKSEPEYSFKYSYLVPATDAFDKTGTYPCYAVYFNELQDMPAATLKIRNLVKALFAKVYLDRKESTLTQFADSMAFVHGNLECFFEGLVQNGFVRKEHLVELTNEIKENPSLLKDMIARLKPKESKRRPKVGDSVSFMCPNCNRMHTGIITDRQD